MLDRAAVDALVEGADVVVHLAFIIMGRRARRREINLEGSRNVFEAAVAAERQAPRLHLVGRRLRLPRRQPAAADRGRPAARHRRASPTRRRRPSSRRVLAEVLDGRATPTPTSSAPASSPGPTRRCSIDAMPYVQLGERLPGAVRALFDMVPVLKPVLPDPGVPFQLVHHDDVAAALRAAVLGRGEPGVYNLAGRGELTVADLADALGWYSVPIPELAVDATAEIVARLPFLPAEARWIEACRTPVLMDTRQGAPRAALAPEARRGETLRATVRGRASRPAGRGRRPQCVLSVTGTPKRRWASPTTSSSR